MDSCGYRADGQAHYARQSGGRIETVAITIDEVYQTLAQDGLLGMALHPDLLKGKGTDYVYVAYT
jgi:hypothetical protein